MKKFLVVVVFCLPAFGQAAYSGLGLYSGSATYVDSSSSCAAPNFCAYDGVDLVPTPDPPDVGGLINNGATVYDTSFIGHTMWNGSIFSNSAYLSPVTRLTDSTTKNAAQSPMAGVGGNGNRILTNTDTSLVDIEITGNRNLCRFNTTTGHCSSTGWYNNGSYSNTGILITTAQNTATPCNSGCATTNFGVPEFSRVNRQLDIVFGPMTGTSTTAQLAVYPVTIVPETGAYTIGSPVADFINALPVGSNAPNWAPNTSYSQGAYVTHVLTSAEMSNGGVWQASTAYNLGDISNNNGSVVDCMYKVIKAGTSDTSAPAFLPASSGCTAGSNLTDNGVTWQSTKFTAQMIYQNIASGTRTSASSSFQWVATAQTIGTGCSISQNSPAVNCPGSSFTSAIVGQASSLTGAWNANSTTTLYTTIASVQSTTQLTLTVAAPVAVSGTGTLALTGHPDLGSSTVGDANGLVWVAISPNYVPTTATGLWTGGPGISGDAAYSGYPSRYGWSVSTNTYGDPPDYKADTEQGYGTWVPRYDGITNTYHLLNTATGIWTDWNCSGGTGPYCTGGSWTNNYVTTLQAIVNPLGNGTVCSQFLHGAGLVNAAGYIGPITTNNTGNTYGVNYLNPACSNLLQYYIWNSDTSTADPYASLEITAFGLSHDAYAANHLVDESSSGWGYTAAVFFSEYPLNNVNGNGTGNPVVNSPIYPPPFSVYLQPLASQSTVQTVPPGCYVTVGGVMKNPDCNLSEVFGSHLSWVNDPGTDTWPACSTFYSAFQTNAWQNVMACAQTYPTYPAGYSATQGGVSLAGQPSVGRIWSFTHTFNTGTSLLFSTQFGVSEISQDGKWGFWGSDWGCTLGSTTGSGPSVWSSGTYYQKLLLSWVDPFTMTGGTPAALCGWQWVANKPYVAGQTVNPIEGLSGSGAVDDVFQALTSGTSGPYTGTITATGAIGPKCGSAHCFAITNPPSQTAIAATATTESGTTATVTVGTGMQLNDGQFVTLAGYTPSGYNGTFAVTGTVGSGCPGASCAKVTTFQLAGLPSGLGPVTTLGTAASQGDTVCDLTTPGSDSLDPALPYSSSCATGVVWQDVGTQTQRGDVFAVELGTN